MKLVEKKALAGFAVFTVAFSFADGAGITSTDVSLDTKNLNAVIIGII